MRIINFTLLAIGFFLSVSAGDAKAQSILDSTVSLSFSNRTIKEVLSDIHKQTKIKFIYSPTAIDLTKTISFTGKNVRLKDFFEKVFQPIRVGYEVVKNQILLYSLKTTAADSVAHSLGPPGRVVKGIVKNMDGAPLPGASVRLKGTSIGTRTDENGNFSLAVPDEAAVLEISYVGYTPQSMTVTGDMINIILTGAISANEEVVVTALGISKAARKIGYASTRVDGSLLNQAKEPNVANSLTGRVAGLNISGVNSGPGSSARILIRGISDFTSATGPLFVIDGVPMDNTQKGSAGVYGGADQGDGISSINPDDIENIVVLKGSTASALYGTRASNGVIQITTRSGKGVRGFGVEYNGNLSFNSIINNKDYQKAFGAGLNGERPMSLSDLTVDGLNSWGGKMDGSPAIAMDGKEHPYKPVAGQYNHFYRIAPVVINTLSFVNGGEKGNMRLSLSQMDNESVIPNSNLKRYSANLNVNQDITGHLKLTTMVNYINENVKNRPFLNDMSRNPNFTMAILPANVDPYYLKPGYNPVNGYENAMNSDGYQTNPWFAVSKFITNTSRNRLISSTVLRYDFSKSLYLQTRAGLDLINDGLFEVTPTGAGFSRRGGLDEQSKAQTTELNLDVLAGYSHRLLKEFSLDAALGGSVRKYQYEKEGSSGNQWKTPFLYTVTNLVSTTPVYQYSKLQTNSGYYTLDLTYRSLLTLSTTGRYDVFSTLPAGRRGIFTPSISSSFIFTNLLPSSGLDFGKLRLSYAQTSGQADPYQTSTYYQVQTGTNAGLAFGNTLPQTSDVRNLKPYRLKEYEAGLELKWLKGRFGLDLTWFHRRTAGELIAKTISIATGYSSTYVPLGSTENKGIELALSGTPVKTRDLSWNISFNFTQVDNKLIDIGDTSRGASIQQTGQGQYRPSVGPYGNGAFVASVQGLPVSQIMAYDYQYDTHGNIIMNNGIPVRGNVKPMGSGLPKYYGGLNNEFLYKRFTFSFLVDYRFGSKVLSGTDFFSIYYGLNKSTLPGRETGVLAKGVDIDGGPNTTVVAAQDYYQGLVKSISTISVFDGSFIKLRQVTAGYLLPPGMLQKTPFASINVSLVARNLLTLLKHTRNFDPEDNFSSLPGNAGLEGGGLPSTRTYGINVNIKFKK
ncbi:MAG: SusC/RagA family TonB-linked outer membrane protein [Chitinophagaceae bacterium]|nr:SusC/RagA family TonB-linked outer membrane protein [Chitinophagaceae bacterium]